MPYNFYPVDRDQQYLFPPSLKDWVPEGDPVWFVIETVSSMDLDGFYRKYRADGVGATAYDPCMMVTLLLYAYCFGERSSRRIEALCQRDVAFKVITVNRVPDHSSICRFRADHEEALSKLFVDILGLCKTAGLLKVGVLALDGTKMPANAALSANRTEESLRAEIRRWFEEAKTIDEEEDRLYGDARGDELPEELRTREGRLARIKECKERLEREKREAMEAQQEKIDRREEEEKRTGRKKRGRKPKAPKDTVKEDLKANVTDPESRIMKGRHGYVQGYNAQAVVTKGQVITAAEITQDENDTQQLRPMLERTIENLNAIEVEEKVKTLIADAGYWTDEAVARSGSDNPELLVATTKDWKQRKAAREMPPPRGRIPKDLSARARMERKLLTKKGRELYRIRGQTVEPVFGQIKKILRFDQFMRRGLKACASEWRLVCAAHNLLKIWRSGACQLGRSHPIQA